MIVEWFTNGIIVTILLLLIQKNKMATQKNKRGVFVSVTARISRKISSSGEQKPDLGKTNYWIWAFKMIDLFLQVFILSFQSLVFFVVTRPPVKRHYQSTTCCVIIHCYWHVSYEKTPCLHWNQKRGSKTVLTCVWSVFIQWRKDVQLRGSTWDSLELSQPPTSVSGPAVEWSGITGTNTRQGWNLDSEWADMWH